MKLWANKRSKVGKGMKRNTLAFVSPDSEWTVKTETPRGGRSLCMACQSQSSLENLGDFEGGTQSWPVVIWACKTQGNGVVRIVSMIRIGDTSHWTLWGKVDVDGSPVIISKLCPLFQVWLTFLYSSASLFVCPSG
ncbi:hypothetical protein RRG08_032274 [Elysia crispata]|uniref:Uncharacterized protein n=1 Tax=Elysia crispata TaxID=231223 RepID=A0AAE1AS79_9GAST|nr:hypothetical protein RRG08_032274 [Elysia crispata]